MEKKKVFISNIEWDTDGVDVPELPNNILLELDKDYDANDIADILSDKYGFCVKSFIAGEYDKEISFYSPETGILRVRQNSGNYHSKPAVWVYDQHDNFLCYLHGYYIVDIIDESALDYYRFIEDMKEYLPKTT